MHINARPPALDLRLDRPLRQPLDPGYTRGILHFILGVVFSQALPELVARGGSLPLRIDMDTAATDPELVPLFGAFL